jgi:hypothetical protein
MAGLQPKSERICFELYSFVDRFVPFRFMTLHVQFQVSAQMMSMIKRITIEVNLITLTWRYRIHLFHSKCIKLKVYCLISSVYFSYTTIDTLLMLLKLLI